MSVFVTADHHFGHANIIKYCNRPFTCVDQMNDVLIKNWNAVVGLDDTIYILGDFVWHSNLPAIINNLNGEKILILGGHDDPRLLKKQIIPTFEYKEIEYGGVAYVLFHYPIENWNKAYHGSVHLHGHSHGNSEKRINRFDVGIDLWDYKPVNIERFQPALHPPKEE